jgi:hypothetical protein
MVVCACSVCIRMYSSVECLSMVSWMQVDVWTLGVIMFIFLGGYHPFDVHGDAIKGDVLKAIEAAAFTFDDPIWAQVDHGAKELIRRLLQVNPADRLSLREFLDSNFIKHGPKRLEDMHACLHRCASVFGWFDLFGLFGRLCFSVRANSIWHFFSNPFSS